MEFDAYYKEFIRHKLTHWNSVIVILKKIRNLEDAKFTWALIWFALTKILTKHYITNETVRGR